MLRCSSVSELRRWVKVEKKLKSHQFVFISGHDLCALSPKSQSEKLSENRQPLKSKRKTPKLWLKGGKGRLLNEKRVKPERKSTKIAAVLLLFCFWAKTVGKCGKKSSNRINLSSFPDMICAPCPQESRSHAYIHHCVRNRPLE